MCVCMPVCVSTVTYHLTMGYILKNMFLGVCVIVQTPQSVLTQMHLPQVPVCTVPLLGLPHCTSQLPSLAEFPLAGPPPELFLLTHSGER